MLCADTVLTRDGLKRSGGRIVEGNKLMVWFMKNDFRATLITVIELVIIIAVVRFLISAGAWWGGVALCLWGVIIRGKVVLKNYKLNVRIL